MTPQRPAVSVVVPFGGRAADGMASVATMRMLHDLELGTDDERIMVDNGDLRSARRVRRASWSWDTIRVVRATGERSPAHARNVGAAAAETDWILFLDADTVPPPDIVDRFFAEPPGEEVGAISGDVTGVIDRPTLAARFAASRNFLSQANHLAHPYRPRAASANLLVRREAFLAVSGFVEGVRAAEDTDFSWRLQDAGWTLDFRPDAVVGHRYRERLSDLRRQWRGYAAGAAWLESRWPGYRPDPALNRFARILLKRVGIGPGVRARASGHSPGERAALGRVERLKFLAVQILLGIDEQIGLRQSNQV